MAIIICNFAEWRTLSDRIDRVFANSPKIPLSSEYYEIARRLFRFIHISIYQDSFPFMPVDTFAEFTRMLQNIKYTIDTFQPLCPPLAEHVLVYIRRLAKCIEQSRITPHAITADILQHAQSTAIAAALSAASMFERYMVDEDCRMYDMCDSNDSTDYAIPANTSSAATAAAAAIIGKNTDTGMI